MNIQQAYTLETSKSVTNLTKLASALNDVRGRMAGTNTAVEQATKNARENSSAFKVWSASLAASARRVDALTSGMSGFKSQQETLFASLMRNATGLGQYSDQFSIAAKNAGQLTQASIDLARAMTTGQVVALTRENKALARSYSEIITAIGNTKSINAFSTAMEQSSREITRWTQRSKDGYTAVKTLKPILADARKELLAAQGAYKLLNTQQLQAKTLTEADAAAKRRLADAIAVARVKVSELSGEFNRSLQAALAAKRGTDSANMSYSKIAAYTRQARAGVTDLGNAQRRFASASLKDIHLLNISWRSYARYFITRILYRAFVDVTRAIRDGIAAASDLQIKLSEIRTISQDSTKTVADWAKELKQLSDSFPESTVELAEAAYQALSNQVVDAGNAMEFLRISTRLANTTLASAKEAVNALSSVINSYGRQVTDAQQISEQYFKIVELGRLRLEDVADDIGNITILGSQAGISFEELGASLTTLTRQGVKANQAMTFLRNVMLKLIKPTDNMKALFAEWGVETLEQATAAFGFIGVLKRLEAATKGSVSEIGELFNRIRATVGAAGLFSGQNLEQFRSDLDEITNASAGAYAEATRRAFATPARRLQLEMQQIRNFFTVDVGFSILSIFDEMNTAVGGFSDAVENATAGAYRLGYGFALFFSDVKSGIAGTKSNILAMGDDINEYILSPFSRIADVVYGTNVETTKLNETLGKYKLTFGEVVSLAATLLVTMKLVHYVQNSILIKQGVSMFSAMTANAAAVALQMKTAAMWGGSLVKSFSYTGAILKGILVLLKKNWVVLTAITAATLVWSIYQKRVKERLEEAAEIKFTNLHHEMNTLLIRSKEAAKEADTLAKSITRVTQAVTEERRQQLSLSTMLRAGLIQQTEAWEIVSKESNKAFEKILDGFKDGEEANKDFIKSLEDTRKVLRSLGDRQFAEQFREPFGGFAVSDKDVSAAGSKEAAQQKKGFENLVAQTRAYEKEAKKAFSAGTGELNTEKARQYWDVYLTSLDSLGQKQAEIGAANAEILKGLDPSKNFFAYNEAIRQQKRDQAALKALEAERTSALEVRVQLENNLLEQQMRALELERERAKLAKDQNKSLGELYSSLVDFVPELDTSKPEESLDALQKKIKEMRESTFKESKILAERGDITGANALLERYTQVVGGLEIARKKFILNVGDELVQQAEDLTLGPLNEYTAALAKVKADAQGLFTKNETSLRAAIKAATTPGGGNVKQITEITTAVDALKKAITDDGGSGFVLEEQLQNFKAISKFLDGESRFDTDWIAEMSEDFKKIDPTLSNIKSTIETITNNSQNIRNLFSGLIEPGTADGLKQLQTVIDALKQQDFANLPILTRSINQLSQFSFASNPAGEIIKLYQPLETLQSELTRVRAEYLKSITNGYIPQDKAEQLIDQLDTFERKLEDFKEMSESSNTALNEIKPPDLAESIQMSITSPLRSAELQAYATARAIAQIGNEKPTTAPTPTPLPVPVKRSLGGWIPGTGSSDSVPAMLTPGEFVVNSKTAATFAPMLEALNKGKGFGNTTSSQSYGDVNVVINNNGNSTTSSKGVSPETARQIADMIYREQARGRVRG